VILICFGLSWCVLRYVLSAAAYAERLEGRGAHPAWAQRGGVLAYRVNGGIWLAGTAALALLICGLDPAEHGISSLHVGRTLGVLLGLGVLCLPTVVKAAQGDEVQRLHPEIRATQVSTRTVVFSGLAWGVFLGGYEYVFRGALLWFLAAELGVWPALAVTSVLYMLVHLPKPAPSETFASLLMGFVFGAAALWTGSFVVAWLLHWAIAVTTETVAGRRPGITWGGAVDVGAPPRG
jgi:membrane protease YdiL (CAAX protease family)